MGLHVWGSNAEVMKTIFFVFFKVSEPGDIPQLAQFSFQLILNLFLHHNFSVDLTWGPVYVLEAKEFDQMISHQGVSSLRSEARFPEMRMRSCRFSAFGAFAASRRASSITWCIGFEGSCVMFPGMVIQISLMEDKKRKGRRRKDDSMSQCHLDDVFLSYLSMVVLAQKPYL